MNRPFERILIGLIFCLVNLELWAAKLQGVNVLDEEIIRIHLLDGEVQFLESSSEPFKDKVHSYFPKVHLESAKNVSHWRISSEDDSNYLGKGKIPQACYLKSKVNGQSQKEWLRHDFRYEYTHEHFIYLRLPEPLRPNKSYSLEISPGVNASRRKIPFKFDPFHSKSDALHVNLVGYDVQEKVKTADLYTWMGDGGKRDYSRFEGKPVYLYNPSRAKRYLAGKVQLWKKGGKDVGGFDLTKSDVWSVDANREVPSGRYRLVVEGIGSSQDFQIGSGIYRVPFRVALKGYYYMRIGEPSNQDKKLGPSPRQPRYIPGKDPSRTRVYLTNMHKWHPSWKTFSKGDPWDRPLDWHAFVKRGKPTNQDAWGGHADALDWDRHLAHVFNIYDLLLPIILTSGHPSDDDVGIPESGNGIPDLIDEARNEVDFWLRLRDGKGYSGGVTNPTKDHVMYQSAATAMAAWASAANAAMLADSLKMVGQGSLADTYKQEALSAYHYAEQLPDKMLDHLLEGMRGRDLKMLAATFLYRLTGKVVYEKVIKQESRTVSIGSNVIGKDFNQTWAVAGYLTTSRPIHYPKLFEHMKRSLINQAKAMEQQPSMRRPSRRSNRTGTGWFRTAHNVQLSLISHAVADKVTDGYGFLRALIQEYDYGLGRNPLNMIQMTTASTELSSIPSVLEAYTSGRNDGYPGVHPGHTPYMNLYDWKSGMTGGEPSKLLETSYPRDFITSWPHGEGFFNTRFIYAHSEFTPRQTMR